MSVKCSDGDRVSEVSDCNASLVFTGVFREAEHSPDRVEDDELILRAVADRLAAFPNVDVRLVFPADLDDDVRKRVPAAVFSMAEEEPVLCLLEELEQQGKAIVNSTFAVRNTFRMRMTSILSGAPFFPETVLFSTDAPLPEISYDAWCKRGDFHAIEKDDVVMVSDNSSLSEVIKRFRERGIKDVALQRHVPGDLIKFYGVGRGSGESVWFHWFYHKDQQLCGYDFDKEALKSYCEDAAGMLGLEVYGGDAIVTGKGEIFIIDVNAWPSFALFRKTAAGYIAEYLYKRAGYG